MTAQSIHDLDELVLQVRDPESRVLFAEAVNAYRAGALRSAVTSTWIALVYDLFAKIRELSVGGDKNAGAFVQQLEHAVASRHIPTLQRMESEILATAVADFELLSVQERGDLDRLQADRNLCAHPALVADHSVFQPTPELVRTHLVHLALHVLRHPPVQGKSALDRITTELSRPSFPDDPARAMAIISERLNRAKDVLVRNLTIRLLKALFFGTDTALASRPNVLINSLMAIAQTKAPIYEREAREALSKWPADLDDGQLTQVFRLISADPRCWGWLPQAARIRVLEIVGKHQTGALARSGAFDMLNIPEIRVALLARFAALDRREKQSVIAENPRPEFAPEAIALYEQAGSWRGAESLGQDVILPMAAHFSGPQLVRVIQAAQNNGQIWDAAGTPEILQRLFDLTIDRFIEAKDAWSAFIDHVSGGGRADWYESLRQRVASGTTPK